MADSLVTEFICMRCGGLKGRKVASEAICCGEQMQLLSRVKSLVARAETALRVSRGVCYYCKKRSASYTVAVQCVAVDVCDDPRCNEENPGRPLAPNQRMVVVRV